MAAARPWVVKLGGSLAGGSRLPGWLDLLADHGGGRAVIVPGGGPFADAVRDAQQRWGFDDGRAHRMALLAMNQFGLLLAGLQPRLRALAEPAAIGEALDAGHLPVWIGADRTLADPALEHSWRVTADSLALWLARRLDARGLILIKSAQPATIGAAGATRTGPTDETRASPQLVDAAFADAARGFGRPIHCLGPADRARLIALLSAAAPPSVNPEETVP